MTQPGIVFGINDSGHDALVFAFDSLGRHRGIYRLEGARNEDWEAAALGPCAPGSSASCLFVGDVGDNAAARPYVSIYRVPEPAIVADPPLIAPIGPASRIDVRYPDRPHDVEAMYLGRDGAIHLITKRRLLDAANRPRPALIFRVPAIAWDSSGIVVAALVDSLPIWPGSAQGRQVTDAALSRDGTQLAVRTYTEVYLFAIDSLTSRPAHDSPPAVCAIAGLEERQGEGIGWWWDTRSLLLTSEGRREPLHVVRCERREP